MAGLIPQRPTERAYNLTPEEMDGLSYYVLSGCAKEVAFLKFIRPDFIGSKATAAIKAAVTQFFATKEVKEYIDSYSRFVSDLLSQKKKQEPKEQVGSMEERKSRAKTKLVEFAMTLADNIGQADDPEFVLKIADKAGLLDQNDEYEELPRRYLPVTCGACEYRKFVEENCDRVEE